jgi:hypothetical protein
MASGIKSAVVLIGPYIQGIDGKPDHLIDLGGEIRKRRTK